jgi:hypothetical protein
MRRAAEKRDDLAAPHAHSITSSARAAAICGAGLRHTIEDKTKAAYWDEEH